MPIGSFAKGEVNKTTLLGGTPCCQMPKSKIRTNLKSKIWANLVAKCFLIKENLVRLGTH